MTSMLASTSLSRSSTDPYEAAIAMTSLTRSFCFFSYATVSSLLSMLIVFSFAVVKETPFDLFVSSMYLSFSLIAFASYSPRHVSTPSHG